MPTTRRRHGQHPTADEKATAQATFLKDFRMCANLTQAAQKAHVDRSTIYYWRQTDPDFAAKFDEAEEEANDHLRAEIYRRAVEGWEVPVVSAGKLVTTTRQYSDRLLELLARARMPEFRDRVDVQGNLT